MNCPAGSPPATPRRRGQRSSAPAGLRTPARPASADTLLQGRLLRLRARSGDEAHGMLDDLEGTGVHVVGVAASGHASAVDHVCPHQVATIVFSLDAQGRGGIGNRDPRARGELERAVAEDVGPRRCKGSCGIQIPGPGGASVRFRRSARGAGGRGPVGTHWVPFWRRSERRRRRRSVTVRTSPSSTGGHCRRERRPPRVTRSQPAGSDARRGAPSNVGM